MKCWLLCKWGGYHIHDLGKLRLASSAIPYGKLSKRCENVYYSLICKVDTLLALIALVVHEIKIREPSCTLIMLQQLHTQHSLTREPWGISLCCCIAFRERKLQYAEFVEMLTTFTPHSWNIQIQFWKQCADLTTAHVIVSASYSLWYCLFGREQHFVCFSAV